MMKKATFFFLFIATLATTTFYSCKTNTDDLWDSIHQLDGRVTSLEELCKQMNGNISSLQKLVQALQDNNSITNVTPVKEGDKTIGYTISFTKGEPITIYHGEKGDKGEQGDKGDDGSTPVVGVKQHTDGTYYWTLNGDWLRDQSGNMIKAEGKDGADGEKGDKGNDGIDGKDGITPLLEIRDGRWYLSVDSGKTWSDIGQATGEDGKNGDNLFEKVEEKEESVEFTLSNGTVLTVPKNSLSIVKGIKSVSYIPRYDDGKATVVGASKADCYIELDFEISPKESADLLVENDGVVSVEGVYTSIRTRAVEFIKFPVLTISVEDGILSLKVSGENLDDVFFAGTQGAQLALKLEDSESTYASDYIGIVPSLSTYTFTVTYQTTSPNQTIKIANDINAYPIAGVGNRLIGIDYGDGTNGTSDTHTYMTQGEYTVTFSFVNEVTEIGEHAFEECSQLTGIEYPNNITKISDYAFHRTGIINIIIPNTVTYIGKSTFNQCVNVKRINIPSNVEILGSRAFANYTTGELYIDCDIPSCDLIVGQSIFYNSNISKIIIGRNVQSIGDMAFELCQVKTIEYEEGNCLRNIGYGAFWCPLIEQMPIPKSVETIGDQAFADCNNLRNFELVSTNNDRNIIGVRDGILYSDDGKDVTIIRYPPKLEGKSYYILLGSTVIAGSAFRDCNNLQSIAFSTLVRHIGESAFRDCKNISSVTDLSSTRVTALGWCAFSGCENLVSIQLPEGLKNIGEYAFDGCGKLDNFVMPNTVEEIGNGAFKGCVSLTGNLIMPDAMETIGNSAFQGCTGVLIGGELYLGKGLKQIGYRAFDAGSDDNATMYSSFRKIYCSATIPPTIDFSSCLSCGQLIVPKGCLEAYRNSEWNNISGNIIEEN